MIFLEYTVVAVTVLCAATYVVRHFYRTFSSKACGKGDCGCTVAKPSLLKSEGKREPTTTMEARPALPWETGPSR